MKTKKRKSPIKLTAKSLALIVAVIAVLAITVIILLLPKKGNGQVITVSKASLREVIEVGELSTLEYSYNSYTPVTTKSKDTKYYVSYEGIVKLGFDFEQIAVNIDEDTKKITVTIPEIKITSVSVDETSLEYIFVKEKYNTETTIAEAFKACEKDLKNKAENNATLKELAKENAISSIKAILTPWEESLPDGYVVEYN